MKMKKVRIGLLGAGRIGKLHGGKSGACCTGG